MLLAIVAEFRTLPASKSACGSLPLPCWSLFHDSRGAFSIEAFSRNANTNYLQDLPAGGAVVRPRHRPAGHKCSRHPRLRLGPSPRSAGKCQVCSCRYHFWWHLIHLKALLVVDLLKRICQFGHHEISIRSWSVEQSSSRCRVCCLRPTLCRHHRRSTCGLNSDLSVAFCHAWDAGDVACAPHRQRR